MKVRAGDRYVERPFRELALEALGAPLLLFAFWIVLRKGWSH